MQNVCNGLIPAEEINATFVSTRSAFPLITNCILVFEGVFFQLDGPEIFLCIQASPLLLGLLQLGLSIAWQLAFLYNGYTHGFLTVTQLGTSGKVHSYINRPAARVHFMLNYQ